MSQEGGSEVEVPNLIARNIKNVTSKMEVLFKLFQLLDSSLVVSTNTAETAVTYAI